MHTLKSKELKRRCKNMVIQQTVILSYPSFIVTNFKILITIIKLQYMLYMIIEKFHPGKVKDLYQRFDEKGRMLPEGVKYINSWIDQEVSICYQVMESDSDEKINLWISHWNDLADFEVIPVLTSAEAKEKVFQARND